MGDFNTDPNDPHLVGIVKQRQLLHPAFDLFKHHQGSLNHQGDWHLFDQILFSRNFLNSSGLRFNEFKIFRPDYLKVWRGKYKNQPFRTYKGKKYQNGYSDHFPVYALLKRA